MAISAEEIYERLVKIAQDLMLIAQELQSTVRPSRIPEAVRDAVERKRKAGICLQCGEVYRDSELPYGGRGLCAICYQNVRYRLRKGETTRQSLIEQGLMAEGRTYTGTQRTPDQIAQDLLGLSKPSKRKKRS